jgi:hypothetical protein
VYAIIFEGILDEKVFGRATWVNETRNTQRFYIQLVAFLLLIGYRELDQHGTKLILLATALAGSQNLFYLDPAL